MTDTDQPSITGFTFPAELRIRNSEDFQQIYQLRNRCSDSILLIYAATNGRDHSRIGLSVSRKMGNAVRRNRLKRLLREAFRLQRQKLPCGYDWILIPQKREQEPTLTELMNSLSQLTRRIAQRREK